MTTSRYTTNDPHLAAFLVSEGAELLSLARTGPKRVLFSFPASRELHVLLRQYWGGHTLPVVPSKLLDTLHDLKCRSITRP
jgi:predicted transcriptional regulator